MLGPVPTPQHGVGVFQRGHASHHSSGYARYGHSFRASNAAWQHTRLLRLRKLKADLDAIAPGATVGQGQKSTLQHDLMAVSQSRIKPPMPPVQQLAGDVASALAGRRQRAINTTRLTLDLEGVMNAVDLSAPMVGHAIESGMSILTDAGAKPADVGLVSRDCQAVAFSSMK
jgi:hypothetical protein